MIEVEITERLVPPSEPPVPDAATKRLKTLGTLTAQAGALLAKRQASAGTMRALADKMQNERAAAAESKDAARHDENALGQPEEPPLSRRAAALRCWCLSPARRMTGSPQTVRAHGHGARHLTDIL